MVGRVDVWRVIERRAFNVIRNIYHIEYLLKENYYYCKERISFELLYNNNNAPNQ